jgi:hypothetical protein
MKLTKKQEEIKAKILAGTHVLYTGELKCTEDGKALLRTFPRGYDWYCSDDYYAMCNGLIEPIYEDEINDRPIINMSEWFDENECSFTTSNGKPQIVIQVQEESTKDMREYDEKLLTEFFEAWVRKDVKGRIRSYIPTFLHQRYPNEALLKEKSELEQRLKEIEEQLGSKG